MIEEVEKSLDAAEAAQEQWAALMPRKRLAAVGRIAERIAFAPGPLIKSLHRPNASPADKLASEILPLADACRFAKKIGRQLLAPQINRLHGSWWIGRTEVTTHREPWGTVLILGPSNYPLFLPGVQAIQAIAAGNAAVVKPAPGCREITECLKHYLVGADIPADLLQVLPEDVEAGQEAIRQGVDKVVLTGSVPTGRAVMRQVAETLTPTTLELGGCDAAFILPQAELDRAAAAIAYGVCLNGGATCIAPRRIFVSDRSMTDFKELFLKELANRASEPFQIDPRALERARKAAEEALSQGASVLAGELPAEKYAAKMQPIVLGNVTPAMKVAKSDLFVPITCLIEYDDIAAAVESDRDCPYSLGASIFGPQTSADHWAKQIDAGCVTINDLIVLTADPRVSFGGLDQSGWGVTRGADGLLEMTRSKTVCTRKGGWLPHLDPEKSQDADTLIDLLKIFHGDSLKTSFTSVQNIIRRARGK